MSICNLDWFAVYTKPRQEHVALMNLQRQSFDCYLPIAERQYKSSSAPSKVRHEPLFPRYLFLSAAPELQNLAVVRSTRGVVGMVRAGFELIKIPAPVITGLKASMDQTTGLISLDSRLSIALNSDDKVRVFDGPFADLEGVFKERQGLTRSLLLFEILGRETAVELDNRLLRRVN